MATTTAFDPKELESKVKAMYRSVAENPHGEFHFEMGRAMAERLGYSPADLDRIPAESIDHSPESVTISTWPISSRAKSSSISAAAPAWTRSSPR